MFSRKVHFRIDGVSSCSSVYSTLFTSRITGLERCTAHSMSRVVKLSRHPLYEQEILPLTAVLLRHCPPSASGFNGAKMLMAHTVRRQLPLRADSRQEGTIDGCEERQVNKIVREIVARCNAVAYVQAAE
jgi:hypothetical protein